MGFKTEICCDIPYTGSLTGSAVLLILSFLHLKLTFKYLKNSLESFVPPKKRVIIDSISGSLLFALGFYQFFQTFNTKLEKSTTEPPQSQECHHCRSSLFTGLLIIYLNATLISAFATWLSFRVLFNSVLQSYDRRRFFGNLFTTALILLVLYNGAKLFFSGASCLSHWEAFGYDLHPFLVLAFGLHAFFVFRGFAYNSSIIEFEPEIVARTDLCKNFLLFMIYAVLLVGYMMTVTENIRDWRDLAIEQSECPNVVATVSFDFLLLCIGSSHYAFLSFYSMLCLCRNAPSTTGNSGYEEAIYLQELAVRLPSVNFEPPDGNDPEATQSTNRASSDYQCAICLEKLNVGEAVHSIQACGHIFHIQCIKGWIQQLHSSCPTCRGSIAVE